MSLCVSYTQAILYIAFESETGVIKHQNKVIYEHSGRLKTFYRDTGVFKIPSFFLNAFFFFFLN